MRISEMAGKEVINLRDGARLGSVGECELAFDGRSGIISGLILPKRKSLFNLFDENQTITIPWQAIKRIGDEIVIVDLNNTYEMYSR